MVVTSQPAGGGVGGALIGGVAVTSAVGTSQSDLCSHRRRFRCAIDVFSVVIIKACICICVRVIRQTEVLGVRHIQALLLTVGFFVSFMMQANTGIAVVVMTEAHCEHTCDIKIYDWNKDIKRMLSGGFFYVMIVSSFLAGYLTTKVNTKLLLLTAVGISTIITYLTPMMIKIFEWKAFLYLRLIQGASLGFVKPCIYNQMVRWLPPDEVMLIGPLILSGIYFGTGFIIMMGGYLGTGQGKWPAIFYFSGNCGLIWCLAYMGLGSNNPINCFYISNRERLYIEESLPMAIQRPYRNNIPWKKIFKSLPIYGIILAQGGNNFAFETYVKISARFYKHKIGFRLNTTGLMAGLPFASFCTCTYCTHFVLKCLQKKKMLNYVILRHVCNGIGQFGAFYCYMICSFFNENLYLVCFLQFLGMTLSSFQLHGYYINPIDLSPNFVGLIVGIITGFAHVFSILGPIASVNIYTSYKEDPEHKALEPIYFTIAMVYLCSGIFWEILGSTRIQPFNDIKEKQAADKLGVRHVQATLLAAAFVVNHMQMGNLGIVVVVMTEHKNIETHGRHKTYDWDQDKVSLITGSFFYSLIVSHILAGYLTTKIDHKRLLMCSSAAGTLTSYLTPIVVNNYGWKAFFFIRLTQGMTQGFVKPVLYTLMVRWLPPDELMLTGPMVLSGMYIGAGFMMCMGGFLGTGQGGWPSIFYFSGNCGLIWCLAYMGLGASSPNKCFYISDLEKTYINQSLSPAIQQPYRNNIPWKKIFTCFPLLVPAISHAANNWAFQICIKLMPVFYQQRLGYSLNITGLLGGVPYIILSMTILIISCVLKHWQKRGKLNYYVVRQVCNGIGQFGAFYCFLICSLSHNWFFSITLHYLGIIITAFQLHGFYMNYIDLAPTYIGLIVGITNGLAHITSILGPYVSIKYYNAYSDQDELWYMDEKFLAWRKIYDYMSLSYLLGGTAFLFLAKVEERPFSKNDQFV